MNKLSPDYAVLPAYSFACCACGHQQAARPSLMMQFGENSGAGTCLVVIRDPLQALAYSDEEE